MSVETTTERGNLGGIFDRTMRSLHGIPDATATKASTVRHISPVLELAQTFIVQTIRHRERGDYIFCEYVGAEGSMRVVLPPEVADTIARQRDALSTKNHKQAARQRAAADKAAGKLPGFLRNGKKARK
jgi:hypothetical protein